MIKALEYQPQGSADGRSKEGCVPISNSTLSALVSHGDRRWLMICVEDEKGDGGEQCASKGYDMHQHIHS